MTRENGQGGHEVQSYLATTFILFHNGNFIHGASCSLQFWLLGFWIICEVTAVIVWWFFSCIHYLPVLFSSHFHLQMTFQIEKWEIPGWTLPPTRRPVQCLELHRFTEQYSLLSQNYTWSENFLYSKYSNTPSKKKCVFSISSILKHVSNLECLQLLRNGLIGEFAPSAWKTSWKLGFSKPF